MSNLNWREKSFLAVLLMLCLTGAVYYGGGTQNVLVEFNPSTFSGDGGNSCGPLFRWNIGTFAGVNSGCAGNHNNTVSTYGWNVDWGGAHRYHATHDGLTS